MIAEKSSVESVLGNIIREVEVEHKQEARLTKHTAKRKLDDINTKNKRRKLNEFLYAEDITCRICYDFNQQVPVIHPCECKGTMGAIHLECLERWLEESNRNTCELCGHRFEIQRTPRYRVLQSIVIWMCLDYEEHQLYVRNIRADFLRCLVVTTIIIACLYIFIVLADFYAVNNYQNFPPARWTTYSLLSMLSLLIFSYFVWTHMVIQYHQRVWFYWWQKTSTVNVVLPTENIDSINYISDVSQV